VTLQNAERVDAPTIRAMKSRVMVATIVLCTFVAAGCSALNSTSSSGPKPVAIRTLPSPGPNDICLLARGGGTLVVDPVSGLGVADTTGHVSHVYWPFGYTARPDADGLALVDGLGRIVAHLGDVVGMTGGFGNDDDWSACQSEPITVLATRSP
jgi:hypothetical protein